jgi:hypothetical protein
MFVASAVFVVLAVSTKGALISIAVNGRDEVATEPIVAGGAPS